MGNNKQEMFGKEYFEEGQGLKKKRVYDWDNTRLFFTVMSLAILKAINPKCALDIGCAKGYLASLLHLKGVDVYGIDISAYAISQAPEDIKGRLSVADIEEEAIPFPDNHFDLVIMLEVLEHLHSFKNVLSQIRRVSKDKGFILVSTPTPSGRYAKADKTHINVLKRNLWISIFKEHGFNLADKTIWNEFKKYFLAEFVKVMPENPPCTALSRMLMKAGSLGRSLRNNLIPYLDYFSFLRSDEIMLFLKD